MAVTEVSIPFDGKPGEGNGWEQLVAEHGIYPEYRDLLEGVPLWGQQLLVDLSVHHPDSFMHSLRVGVIVSGIITGEQKTENDLLETIPNAKLRQAALLHDIGKREVPQEILNAHHRLSTQEWGQIKLHPARGYAVVDPYDHEVAQIVGGHHMVQGERSYGYPGAETVSEDVAAARMLVAAADVVDALGSKRSYKPGMSPGQVREVMRREGNFHRKLIDILIDVRFSRPPFSPASQQDGWKKLPSLRGVA